MNDLKDIKRDILIVAAGELLAAAVMLLVYFFLHKLTGLVALSALLGVLLATGNYALMAAGVLSASKKAAAGDEAGAKRALNLSRILRYLILAGILAAAALSGYFDLPELSFPGLKWEDEPIEVEITITSK